MEETWMVFLLPDAGLFVKTLMDAAEASGLKAKGTCFGAVVEGEAGKVRQFLHGLGHRYPGSIYVKRRCFSIEDSAICASTFRQEPDEGLPPWLTRYAGQIRRYTS